MEKIRLWLAAMPVLNSVLTTNLIIQVEMNSILKLLLVAASFIGSYMLSYKVEDWIGGD